MERKPNEKFKKYQRRRQVANIIRKIKSIPKLVWNSKERGTFVRGRDTLVNSRADANRKEAIKRKQERRDAYKKLHNL